MTVETSITTDLSNHLLSARRSEVVYTEGVFERPVGLAREKAVIVSRLVRAARTEFYLTKYLCRPKSAFFLFLIIE